MTALESIFNLDLEPIMVKIMDPEEGLGWSLDFTLRVEKEYKKYLALCALYPDNPVVPSSFVDDFWHFHILDTQKYQDDCMKCFGYFLHHFPYFGMRGPKDAENLKAAWSETLDLYREIFGEPDAGLWPTSKRCPNCGRRCRDMRYAMEERPRLPVSV